MVHNFSLVMKFLLMVSSVQSDHHELHMLLMTKIGMMKKIEPENYLQYYI